MELDVLETIEEELVDIASRCQVGAMTIEISHSVVLQGCSSDDVMKGQAK